MDKRIEKWKKCQKSVELANDWEKLPSGRKYDGDKFNISVAHCTPPILCRAGQQTCGGQAYWKTDKEFSQAILEYLVDGWSDHFPLIIERMKKQENVALLECQAYLDDLQLYIDKAKGVRQ